MEPNRFEVAVKSTQYKKLAPNVHIHKIWNLANHMKKQNKKHQNAKSIGEKLKSKGLMFFVSFFSCVFARFQILICEP